MSNNGKYQQKEGDVAIFFQDPTKKTNPNGPDWTGKGLYKGEEIKIALWYKRDTMLTGKIQENTYNKDSSSGHSARPTQQGVDTQNGNQPQQAEDPFDDDIPF